MTLTVEDQARLQRWWAESRARGVLPSDMEIVQGRLIRQVGRSQLPDAGEVYVKLMAFPRLKDRIRYLFRTLPARHEARMLGVLAAAGIPCPEVLEVREHRVLGVPCLCTLVLRGLARASRAPDEPGMAALASELVRAGVFHGDLHRSNFLPLADGGMAVLDVHSARLGKAGLTREQRVFMGSRLIGGPPLARDPECLVRAGFLQDSELQDAREHSKWFRRKQVLRMIRRCLQQGNQFRRHRRWNGVVHARRGDLSGGFWHSGGAELRRWWIGDRTLEVLEQRPPALRALFRRSLWLPGRHSVYIARPLEGTGFSLLSARLLKGHAAFLGLLKGAEVPEDWAGTRSAT